MGLLVPHIGWPLMVGPNWKYAYFSTGFCSVIILYYYCHYLYFSSLLLNMLQGQKAVGTPSTDRLSSSTRTSSRRRRFAAKSSSTEQFTAATQTQGEVLKNWVLQHAKGVPSQLSPRPLWEKGYVRILNACFNNFAHVFVFTCCTRARAWNIRTTCPHIAF